jgi:outer membrane biosynthesis protein TonB
LTDDQKAMLRLLAQREEGYDDMAALMGISVEEVRERVKEALAEVEEPPVVEEEPAAPTPPPAPVPPPPDPEPPVEEPEAPAPTPEPPASPAIKPTPKSAPKRPTGKRSAQIPSLKVPKDRGALIGLGAGALVVVALVIVLIVGGDGGGSSSSTSEGNPNENARALAANKNLTQAVLSADDGSDGSGQAIFGRFKKKVLLQVTGEGLEPSADGESYAVWLSHAGNAMVPVGTAKVKDSGELAARFEVPAAVLVLVARAAFDQIEVTRTSDSQLNVAIAKARKTESESTYTGTPVLSGKITGPLVGAGGK